MRAFVLAGCVLLVALVGGLSSAGCGLPRDPMGTLERVRGGEMRVGLVPNGPWTTGGPSGVEVRLMESFARELGAETTYVEGTAPELLQAARPARIPKKSLAPPRSTRCRLKWPTNQGDSPWNSSTSRARG